MPESEDRIERLEREMRRQRGWILVLGIALVATFILGATQGTPDELTLRKLTIVDADGKERIVAMTDKLGSVRLVLYDNDEKQRIVLEADTTAASLIHYDKNEKSRIVSIVGPGSSAAMFFRDSTGEGVWGKISE